MKKYIKSIVAHGGLALIITLVIHLTSLVCGEKFPLILYVIIPLLFVVGITIAMVWEKIIDKFNI